MFLQLGVGSPSVGSLLVDLLGDGCERRGRLSVLLGQDDRPAVVAAGAQLPHERDLTEQRRPEALGEVLAAAVAEDVVALAVVTGEPAHVLDDALHLEVHLRSEEHTSELQSLMRISYAVFCLKKKKSRV